MGFKVPLIGNQLVHSDNASRIFGNMRCSPRRKPQSETFFIKDFCSKDVSRFRCYRRLKDRLHSGDVRLDCSKIDIAL